MRKKLLELALDEELPPSEWINISQADINLFAQATGDQQWIHVDTERCARESPFRCTIAHGYLSVTLMPNAFYQMIEPDSNNQVVLNYGVDKIRFLEPVLVNDEIRFVTKLLKTEQKSSGLLFTFATEVQIKRCSKPAMLGTFLMLLAGYAP